MVGRIEPHPVTDFILCGRGVLFKKRKERERERERERGGGRKREKEKGDQK